MDYIRNQLEQFIKKQKDHRRWAYAFVCLSVIVVLALESVLGLDGIAMTQQQWPEEQTSDLAENETTAVPDEQFSASEENETTDAPEIVTEEIQDEHLQENVTVVSEENDISSTSAPISDETEEDYVEFCL